MTIQNESEPDSIRLDSVLCKRSDGSKGHRRSELSELMDFTSDGCVRNEDRWREDRDTAFTKLLYPPQFGSYRLYTTTVNDEIPYGMVLGSSSGTGRLFLRASVRWHSIPQKNYHILSEILGLGCSRSRDWWHTSAVVVAPIGSALTDFPRVAIPVVCSARRVFSNSASMDGFVPSSHKDEDGDCVVNTNRKHGL